MPNCVVLKNVFLYKKITNPKYLPCNCLNNDTNNNNLININFRHEPGGKCKGVMFYWGKSRFAELPFRMYRFAFFPFRIFPFRTKNFLIFSYFHTKNFLCETGKCEMGKMRNGTCETGIVRNGIFP